MAMIPMRYEGGVQSKVLSNGQSIDAWGSATFTDSTLAGKTFQGIALSGAISTDKDIHYTSAYIDSGGANVVLVNASSSAKTFTKLTIFYKD